MSSSFKSSGQVSYELRGDVAVMTVSNAPVNALSLAIRQDLVERIKQFEEDDAAKAAVIVGAGKVFIAGADIREFKRPATEPHLPDVIDGIEACSKPVIAAIHGVALGGGLEVALGCHFRVGVKGAKVGLPEVHLGIIPGAGGTQRLPRLAGYETALEMIPSGAQVGVDAAKAVGILDEVSEEADAVAAGLSFARSVIDNGTPLRHCSELVAPAVDPQVFADAKAAVAKRARGQKSPVVCVEAIEVASQTSFADGMAKEREMFMELKNSAQHRALSHAFFADRALGKLPEIEGIASRELKSIGVIGGGTMGAGIATGALMNGLSVTLIERDDEALNRAKATIAKNTGGAVKKGKLSAEQEQRIFAEALSLSTDYASLSDVDLVVEAVFEDITVKKQVFQKLDEVCKDGAVLATNTSYLDVNAIADVTKRPQDVIGLHFFSPAHIMKLLEVVVADKTAPDVIATGFQLGKIMRKVAVRAGVCDGFIGNRILATYRAAADAVVVDGSSPFEVDEVMLEFGFPMGPYAVADLAGLDIGWATRKRKAPTRDPRERYFTFADRMCEQGWFGQKTSKGYYVYEEGARKGTPNPAVLEILTEERKEKHINAQNLSKEQILDRYMAAMVNEAAKVVEEGIALRPLDVDMTLIYGYGFPRWRGGPMQYADEIGLEKILNNIKVYAQEDVYFWQPAKLLEKLVSSGKTFADLNAERGNNPAAKKHENA
ncbi:Fatty acid oxidation complex subunit alpha [Pseudovibrio sp. Ad13]|uniref:3-hydroxyacyl-CoA dehydrogenase NAD-binding domain-containing protein n=1 Tax=Pseudovibrio sp. Ad13 TaxID=989396 RepID=UPI0007AE8242|nr:3-hydroxyacyl-CoA dehydrogenase NAD-binding domain-containing protein [Pseudovibrio sp. Ad13]KZK79268.1 Fatty acid oxidation complex subunit alpha [Pseudovibrio sp. Ad13]